MIIRISKIVLVASVAFFAFLVGVDNILDYEPNFEAVRHILSMDAIPGDSPLLWRAITDENMQRLGYSLIIATEIVSGLILTKGAADLYRALPHDGRSFNRSKEVATLGLVALFVLYYFGFIVVGGEWFQMWRSAQWNEQEAAFRFLGCIGLILLILRQTDVD
jgi:predicted small integral membrane protein